jgi:hypothetical protein
MMQEKLQDIQVFEHCTLQNAANSSVIIRLALSPKETSLEGIALIRK